MTNPQDPLLLDHEVDGIRELDNQLPRWWLWLFILTSVFSGLYLIFYHVSSAGDSQADAYIKEMAWARREMALQAAQGGSGGGDAIENDPPATNEVVLTHGKEIFTTHCVVCHGPQAQGLVGPNLTDMYFLHGPAFKDEIHTIRNGVIAKGMISWKTVLKPSDIQAVASFVYTLRGSNPPNPKPPQGVKFSPENAN